MQALTLRQQAGEALSPAFVELMVGAQKRLAEARFDAAPDPASRRKAAEHYVQAVKATHDMVQKRFEAGLDTSQVQVSQAAYHVADAEYLLARIEAGM